MPGRLGQVLPYQQKTDYSCAAATLHAVLRHWGNHIGERRLMPMVGVEPDVGAYAHQIVDTARRLGYKAEERRFRSVDDLKRVTDTGTPVIANVLSFTRPPDGHFVVVTDVGSKKVRLMDPNVAGNQRTLSRKAFDARWKTRGRSGVVVSPKDRTLGNVTAARRSLVPIVVGVVAVAAVAGAVTWAVRRQRA